LLKFDRAQFSLEFLMTYGWAILATMAVIAALGYLGMGGLDRTPEKCIFPSGFSCLGTQVTKTQSVIVIRNGMGTPLYDMNANLSGTSITCTVAPTTCRDEATFNITCDTSTLNYSTVTRLQVALSYKKSSDGYYQLAMGDITAKKK
jgi:hypothetical protein